MSNAADDAIELAALCGLELDPWQQRVLRVGLGERADGKWSAFEVGMVVSRQSGKGAVLAARELAGLVLFGEQMIIHSAHEFATSNEHFHRLLELVERCPDLDQMVKRVSRSHGEEGIELKSGARLRFRTRTRGGGRGFSGDLIVIDEAYELPDAAVAALLPVLSARPNPQVWYASSAVDQMNHPHGMALAAARKRAMSDDPGALAWIEWSLDAETFWADPERSSLDPDVWAACNPAMPHRVSVEHVARERAAMSLRSFAVERLSVGDWPDPDAVDEDDDFPLPSALWDGLVDTAKKPAPALDPVTFGLHISGDRSRVTIGAAGWRADGRLLVEVVSQPRSVAAAVEQLVALTGKHETASVVVDGYGGAAELLERAGVTARVTSASDMATACGRLVDLANESVLVHLGQSMLDASLEHAVTRTLSGGFAWKSKSGDVTPLVAVTLAAFGAERPAPVEDDVAPFFMTSR